MDVSAHQGRINWSKVARNHIAFAYIKASEGGDFTDQSYALNWTASKGAGLARGAYHFTVAHSGLATPPSATPPSPKTLVLPSKPSATHREDDDLKPGEHHPAHTGRSGPRPHDRFDRARRLPTAMIATVIAPMMTPTTAP